MDRTLLWKGVLVLAVAAVATFSAVPLEEKLRLGLDLRGGIHLVLRVEADDAVR